MAEQKQAMNGRVEPLYLPAEFYMMRAPALPAQVFLQLSTAGHIYAETMDEKLDEVLQRGKRECVETLLELAARPEIRQAVAIASPSLLGGLRRLKREGETEARRARVHRGLLRYLIRMSTRPTPFGLFSGVGVGRFAEKTGAQLGDSAIRRFRTRPDMNWLLAILKKLEEDRALVEQLQVGLNQMAYLVGDRAVLPFADIYGEVDNRAISLRATAVVRKVFEVAQHPVLFTALSKTLQETFPRATKEQIESLLWQLWEHHFLISQLHPPLTEAQPVLYVQKTVRKGARKREH